MAIVRYVKSEDADPYLAGLWPISDSEMGWSLLLYRLPCAEDVREYAFPSLNHFSNISSSGSIEKLNAVSSLVDSLTVREEGALCLTPINPTLHTLLAEVHRRIVGADPKQVLPVENPLVPKIQVLLIYLQTCLKATLYSLALLLCHLSTRRSCNDAALVEFD